MSLRFRAVPGAKERALALVFQATGAQPWGYAVKQEDAEKHGHHVAPKKKVSKREKIAITSENLVKLIPAEASGLYLAVTANYAQPEKADFLVWSIVSLGVLILIRVLARAGALNILFSAGAFVLWMTTIQNGSLRLYFPEICTGPRCSGIVLAYTVLTTALANILGEESDE